MGFFFVCVFFPADWNMKNETEERRRKNWRLWNTWRAQPRLRQAESRVPSLQLSELFFFYLFVFNFQENISTIIAWDCFNWGFSTRMWWGKTVACRRQQPRLLWVWLFFFFDFTVKRGTRYAYYDLNEITFSWLFWCPYNKFI